MGLHKQLQLPGLCMCIVKSRSYRTCLEMLGVESVCPRLWLHQMDICLLLVFVLRFKLRQTSPQTACQDILSSASKILYIYSFILQVRKEDKSVGVRLQGHFLFLF